MRLNKGNAWGVSDDSPASQKALTLGPFPVGGPGVPRTRNRRSRVTLIWPLSDLSN